MDGNLTGTTTLGQNGTMSNGNAALLNACQISRVTASPSDAI